MKKTTLTAATLTAAAALTALTAALATRELTPPPPLNSPLCWLDHATLHCATNIGDTITITTTNQTYTATVQQTGLAIFPPAIQAGQPVTIAAIPPLTIPTINTWRTGDGLVISTPITSTLIYYQHAGLIVSTTITPITPGLTLITITNPHPADRAIVEAHLPGLVMRVPALIHARYFPTVRRLSH